MAKYLIDHWFDFCRPPQVFNIFLKKIGYTDRTELSGLISSLQCLPCCTIALHVSILALIDLIPGLWAVNDHQIKIIKTHISDGLVNACRSRLIRLMFCGNLRRNKELLSWYTAGADSFAHTTLISISLCRIYMTVSYLYSRFYSISCLVIANKPGAESQHRDFHSIT